jgi:PKD repeat protein
MRSLKGLTTWTLLVAMIFAFLLSPALGYIQGDMNEDQDVTLGDAVLIMKFMSKVRLSKPLQKESGVGSDPRIGLDDLVYVLQVVSGLRSKNSSPTASFSLLSADTGDAPLLVEFDASGSSDTEGSIVAYQWDFGDGESAGGASSAVTHIYGTPGTYQCTLTIVDEGGARGTFKKWIAVTGQTDPPPDPATVAPPLDTTVPTSIKTATEFLYTGVNPIQEGVIPDKIERKRAAVLRGKVTERDGEALSGVRVTVLDHPEFGQTLSRDDGMFDLAVNGGALLTVRYEKAGFLMVQRRLEIPWNDIFWLPDVAMVLMAEESAVLSLSGTEPIQVAQGPQVVDERGERQSTLLMSQGTGAWMVLPGGATQPFDTETLTVRATEYTVGEDGPPAMPDELPPGVNYTYCVELSVDEAAGAASVVFDRPLYHYVENFLGTRWERRSPTTTMTGKRPAG